MSTTLPLKRTFNALTGGEIKKLILKEFEEQLNEDSNLDESLTYPILEWYAVLKFRAYPRTPERFESRPGGEVVEYKRDTEKGEIPAFTPSELGEPVTGELTSENIVDAENPPDKVREDNGLPVSMPEKSDMMKNVVVDKARIRPRGDHHKVE